MIKRKKLRQKGKLRLTAMFKELKEGDKVMLIRIPGSNPFPARFHGKTAEIVGKSGNSFIVKFLNGKMIKKLVIKPEYLKKLE